MHITAGFLSYQLLFQLIPILRASTLVTGTIMRDTTNDRTELWSQAIHLIQDHPILGIGPMHFAWASSTVAHPHNSVLQLMAEWGLPATLIILGLAGYGIFCWFKRFNANSLQTETQYNSHLAIVLFFTITTSAAYSLVDGVIVMPISQVLLFTFIGLMIGLYSKSGQATNVEAYNTNSVLKPVFASLILITLTWSTLPEMMSRPLYTESYPRERTFFNGLQRNWPSFLVRGKVTINSD